MGSLTHLQRSRKMKFLAVAATLVTLSHAMPASQQTTVDCSGEADGTFIADPSDCSKFFVCSHGEATSHQCVEPLLFDPSQNVCNWPSAVDCKVETTTTTTTTTEPAPPIECPAGKYSNQADPEDCKWYYICKRDGSYEHKKCSFGKSFDQRFHGFCNWSLFVKCCMKYNNSAC